MMELQQQTKPVQMDVRVTEALAFAEKAHGTQLRKYNGDPYIVHPRRVVARLKAAGVTDVAVLQAAALHDVVEDTPVKLAEIQVRFGEDVAGLVKELTKAEDVVKRDYVASFQYAMPRACLIKLADRCDNLLDRDDGDVKRRRGYALEGMEIMAACLRNKRSRTPEVEAAWSRIERDLFEAIRAPLLGA